MSTKQTTGGERDDAVRRAVRENYGALVRGRTSGCCGESAGCCGGEESAHATGESCCGGQTGHVPEQEAHGGGCCGQVSGSSCCGEGAAAPVDDFLAQAARLGYSLQDVSSVPKGAEFTFGCGNPQALAALRAGETVLDLGSGGGLDCFLAAHRVGPTGRVIGVDMTADMLETARASARRAGYTNVEFRLGEIEHLPVADDSVDVIISNCVINLSPDKPAVFRETFRVLKPGGRLAISDVVALAPLPAAAQTDEGLWCGCMGGAEEIGALEAILREAGFANVRVTPVEESRETVRSWAPGDPVTELVISAAIEAVKPA